MKTAVKRLYEGLFLVDSAWAASEWETVLGTIRKFLERAGADIESIKKWDDRRLAYEVEGKSRGTYILAYFYCEPSRVHGIERDVNLSEKVLRALILRADHLGREDIDKPTPAELHPEGVPFEDVEPAEEPEVPAGEDAAAPLPGQEDLSEDETQAAP
ncbi:MAG TPA: 30S ribosomal protein S6 [Anaerohalosphaeraceae bacterium]|nr:30S ribosomal protein S6 [Anaerohalosphaeraceae bacterium]HQG06285.1 30S ribosomal protein S6 [Anaerohalosphaeraceae bacterium]HQI07656.1 30S ribosomal protein S6 [Anaerohalosphaeraceae bacterium]HQJ67873.1 30S ribosomal protein S6 [Anaerohalosphaeraceae bacterium]